MTNNTVYALPVSRTDLFAGTGGGVFRSTDNGAGWGAASSGLTNTIVYALAVLGTNIFAGTNGGSVFVGGLSSALPVDIMRFGVKEKPSGPELRWTTATEVDNYGFEIERTPLPESALIEDGTKGWGQVGFVKGNGTSNAPTEYSFTDKNLSAGRYAYRLKQIDRDGQFKYSKEIAVDISNTPNEFGLTQNYPNTFNAATVISYQLAVNSHVTLKVYDALGREAAILVNEEKEAGKSSVQWDASRYPSGVYYYTLQAGEHRDARRMMLLK